MTVNCFVLSNLSRNTSNINVLYCIVTVLIL